MSLTKNCEQNGPGPKNSDAICGTIPYRSFLFGFMKSYIFHTQHHNVR